jgi:integrase
MPQKADHIVRILEGKALLFLRPNSSFWQVKYKADGQWLKASTKKENLSEATSAAVDIVTNAWFREKNALPVLTKRFKDVARLAINRMDEVPVGERGQATFRSYKLALKNYLTPFFGVHLINKIDYDLLERFAAWREEKMKIVPSSSTLNTHTSALNRVFDEAVLRGFITKSQVPYLKMRRVESERRPDFNEDEWKILYTGMRRWVKAARKGREIELRTKLQNYILILANTGIRAGTEGMNLKWRHISVVDHNNKKYLTIFVKGKTGGREIQVRHSVARYLQRIQERDPELNKMTFHELLNAGVDKYVFRMGDTDKSNQYGRMFVRLLKSLGLYIDKKTDKPRTLYSLRHFYATYALQHTDITPYQLSKNMGTSVQMLEQHYEHLRMRDLAYKFAGEGTIEDALLNKNKPKTPRASKVKHAEINEDR